MDAVRIPERVGAIAWKRHTCGGSTAGLGSRIRPPGDAPGPTPHAFRADGQLDTGATTSAVPVWLLRRLGIPLDKKTRRQIYSVSGKLWAYGATVGMEILCGGTWLDLGESKVLVPDTPDQGIRASAARSCSDWEAFSTGPACASTTHGRSFGSSFPRASGGNGTGRPHDPAPRRTIPRRAAPPDCIAQIGAQFSA